MKLALNSRSSNDVTSLSCSPLRKAGGSYQSQGSNPHLALGRERERDWGGGLWGPTPSTKNYIPHKRLGIILRKLNGVNCWKGGLLLNFDSPVLLILANEAMYLKMCSTILRSLGINWITVPNLEGERRCHAPIFKLAIWGLGISPITQLLRGSWARPIGSLKYRRLLFELRDSANEWHSEARSWISRAALFGFTKLQRKLVSWEFYSSLRCGIGCNWIRSCWPPSINFLLIKQGVTLGTTIIELNWIY